jgi:serine/tyrosine/threonine adenylyltransferase
MNTGDTSISGETIAFRLLCAASVGAEGDAAVRALFADGCAYDAWAARWRRRMTEDTMDPDVRSSAMEAVNPADIPRNHLVEAALDAAVSAGISHRSRNC